MRSDRGQSGAQTTGRERGSSLVGRDGSPNVARNRTTLKVLLLVVSSVVSLAAVEGALRVIGKYSGQAYSVNPTGSQYKFYKFDPVLGWANAPGMRGTYSRDEFTYPIAVNAHSMRQHDVSLERVPGRKRIAVIGDSFVWGVGVSDEQRLTERLAEKLDAEVLNFGVAGYGPIQYVLTIDRILAFDPDLVLLIFCLGNDWGDNVLFDRYDYFKPYAVPDEQAGFEIRGYPLPNVDDFGFNESDTGSVLLDRLVGAFNRGLGRPEQAGLVGYHDWMVYHLDDLDEEQRALTEQAIEINEALLVQLDRKIRAAGTPWAIVPAPTKCEYSQTCVNDDSGLRLGALRILEATAARIGVPMIETVSLLDGSYFWKKDGHWKPEGHERIASQIAETVRETGLLAP